MRSSIRDITRPSLVVIYRCFGTTYRSYLQRSSSPETSVNDYQARPRNIPQEREILTGSFSVSLSPPPIQREGAIHYVLGLSVRSHLPTASATARVPCFQILRSSLSTYHPTTGLNNLTIMKASLNVM